MRDRAISTESLCRHSDTSLVVVEFLTGVIVGVLIGLAAAPFLQAWLLWRQSRAWYPRHPTSYERIEDPSSLDL